MSDPRRNADGDTLADTLCLSSDLCCERSLDRLLSARNGLALARAALLARIEQRRTTADRIVNEVLASLRLELAIEMHALEAEINPRLALLEPEVIPAPMVDQ